MAVERTFSIVKPDAVRRDLIGKIYSRFESGGLKIIASRMIQLTRLQAQEFYAIHRERPSGATSSAKSIPGLNPVD